MELKLHATTVFTVTDHVNRHFNVALVWQHLVIWLIFLFCFLLPFRPRRLLILLQRRKKYKTRTILGYKTLAEGVIRMDAVLQKSMDMTVELTDTGKSGRPGFPIATIRATQVSTSPVDQDNKNNNSVLISGKPEVTEFREMDFELYFRFADRGIGNEYSDEDEEQEFSSNEDNDDGLTGYAAKRNYASKRDNYRKLGRNENDAEAENVQGDSDSDFEVKVKGSRANKMSRVSAFVDAALRDNPIIEMEI